MENPPIKPIEAQVYGIGKYRVLNTVGDLAAVEAWERVS